MNHTTTTPLRLTVTDLHGKKIIIPIKRNVSPHTITELCAQEAESWDWSEYDGDPILNFTMDWEYRNKNGLETVGTSYIRMEFE